MLTSEVPTKSLRGSLLRSPYVFGTDWQILNGRRILTLSIDYATAPPEGALPLPDLTGCRVRQSSYPDLTRDRDGMRVWGPIEISYGGSIGCSARTAGIMSLVLTLLSDAARAMSRATDPDIWRPPAIGEKL